MSVLILSGFLLLITGCKNTIGRQDKNQTGSEPVKTTGSEDYPSYVRFLSFQNPDSTWGYTIFLNSRPYIHQKKIPVPDAVSGFQSERDAERVAGLFVKMIQKGNLSPELNQKTVDSLGIIMKIKK